MNRRARLLLVAMLAAACKPRAPEVPRTASGPAPTPAATGSVTASSADPQRLVGRWLRGDSNYVIEILAVGADGALTARYLNPNPIHVARAEARREDGVLHVLVELQDRGYPGSYYTLAYDPGSDTLAGVYHHLGLNQEFDVAFTRLTSP